jgi:hypothetical protein
MPGSAVAVALVLVVGSQAMLPIARAPIASAPIRPVALPLDVALRPSAPISLPSPFAESTSGGDLSVFNSDVLKANAGLSIYGSSVTALNTPASLDVLQANPTLTAAIYESPLPNVSSLINSDVLKAGESLLAYGLSATARNTPAGLDVLQANPALTAAIYASPLPNVSSLINSDVLKAGESLPAYGLSATALNTPAGLDVLQTNPALTAAIYASSLLNVSSLINGDVLKASEGLPSYKSPATSLVELAALDTSITGGLTNSTLTSSSIAAIVIPTGDVLNANGALPQLSLSATSLYNFRGSDLLRYGGTAEYPLSPLATPPQVLAPECALCGGVKL